jgi:hypothetical protein
LKGRALVFGQDGLAPLATLPKERGPAQGADFSASRCNFGSRPRHVMIPLQKFANGITHSFLVSVTTMAKSGGSAAGMRIAFDIIIDGRLHLPIKIGRISIVQRENSRETVTGKRYDNNNSLFW